MAHDDDVAEELQVVAERPLHDLFDKIDRKDVRAVPTLAELAQQHFPAAWKADRVHALEQLLRHGIRRLRGQFGTLSQQLAAHHLFNLDGQEDFPNVKPLSAHDIEALKGPTDKGYGYVRRKLAKQAGFDLPRDDKRIQRVLRSLRLELANILLDPQFPFALQDTATTPSGRPSIVRPVLADQYVPRHGYEQQIREYRDSGEVAIWLWGDAGTGKSRLARAANRDRLDEHSVSMLTPANEAAFSSQMAQLLIQSGIKGNEFNAITVEALFLTQLSKGKLPKVIVFDDMSDADYANTLTAAARDSFLIFTSIAGPEKYRGARLEVRGMSEEEVNQMISSRLPDKSDAEVSRLAAVLAGRPLAIEHSCSFLRTTGMPVADYCLALSQKPAHILKLAGGQQEHTLTKGYEITLDRLATESPQAVKVLDQILFTEPGALTEDMLSFLWADSVTITSAEMAKAAAGSLNSHFLSLGDAYHWPGVTLRKPKQIAYVDPLASANLFSGLRTLVSFGIIRSEGGHIAVHQLTRAILCDLRSDKAIEVHERVRDTVDELLDIDEWEPGEPLMGDIVLWAPHVARAVAQLDATDPDIIRSLSAEEVNSLARLGAMVVRAYRQIGIFVMTAVDSIKHLYGIVSVRALWTGYDDAQRRQLFPRFFGLYNELMAVVIMDAGFDRDRDGSLSINEVSGEQRRLANGIRLACDTEWELSHGFVQVSDDQLHYPKEQKVAAIDGFDLEQAKNSADHAMLISRVYYDRCQWRDAIAALEHAFTCYTRIGGDIGAVCGAIDAARRLARVHLRAGPSETELAGPMAYIDHADEWLAKARQLRERRSLTIINGKPSRFRLHDVLLDAQLAQAATEVTLTRQLIVWEDNPDESLSPEEVRRFAAEPYRHANGSLSNYSRLQEAEQSLSLLQRIRGLRLIPEFRMHIVRLCLIAQDARAELHINNLRTWFTNKNLHYHLVLLDVQTLTLSTTSTALILMPEGPDLLAQSEQLSDRAREEMLAARDVPIEIGNRYYSAASAMRKHLNPYWHARGLAATLIVGTVTERERSWIDGVRIELDKAATAIGRTDWIEKANAYDETNVGLWLLGY